LVLEIGWRRKVLNGRLGEFVTMLGRGAASPVPWNRSLTTRSLLRGERPEVATAGIDHLTRMAIRAAPKLPPENAGEGQERIFATGRSG
jgi:hypothetical protein